jgi:hypothetical protein
MKTFILSLILIFYVSGIRAQESRSGDFPDGWKMITEKRKFGFIDSNGIEIVKPKYTSIGKLGEYKPDWMLVSIKKGDSTLLGFIDMEGLEVVQPKYIDIGKLGEYKPDWMLVSIKKGDSTLLGFIDMEGLEVIEPIYDSIDDLKSAK